MAEGAQHEPERRCCFALALAGEHHHQAFLFVAFFHPLTLHFLAPFHPFAVARIVLFWRQMSAHAEIGGGLVQHVRFRGVVGHGLWAVMRCRARPAISSCST